MKTIAQLECELARAKEEILWLRDAVTPSQFIVYHGVSFTLSERTVIHALENTEGWVSSKSLRRRLDIVLMCIEESTLKSVDVLMSRLRTKLTALTPPIEILSAYGVGHRLDDVNKQRVAELRR